MNVAVVAEGAPARSLRIGRAAYPLVLPNPRDARLHLAIVIISIHVLGQVAFDFRVTVAQILAAILTAGAIDLVVTFARDRRVVWPASALLTGSGIGLILRDAHTSAGNTWGTQRWYLFAGVSALAMTTKYVLRWRGQHVFNPSNIALVAAFLVLGSGRVEPLDFWWTPLDGWMVFADALILIGGILITRRLGLFAMGAAFWLSLAASIGVLSWSGHAITTTWSVAPVSGLHFWWTIVSSPEVLIFTFFMLTDPKTMPAARVARIVFGVAVGLVATLLAAPQHDEFATKVALLGALSITCAGRFALARALPRVGTAADRPAAFVMTVLGTRSMGAKPSLWLGIGRLACIVPLLAVPIVRLGAGARTVAAFPAPSDVPDASAIVPRVQLTTLPVVSMDDDLGGYSRNLEGDGTREIVEALYWDLAVEAEALRRRDADLLRAVDLGARLTSMSDQLEADFVETFTYAFESVHFGYRRLGGQSAPVLTVRAIGHAVSGDRTLSIDTTFALRRMGDDRWLIVAILE